MIMVDESWIVCSCAGCGGDVRLGAPGIVYHPACDPRVSQPVDPHAPEEPRQLRADLLRLTEDRDTLRAGLLEIDSVLDTVDAWRTRLDGRLSRSRIRHRIRALLDGDAA